MILETGDRGHGEFLQRERSAGSINDCAKVCDFAEESPCERRVGNQFADHTAFRNHPICRAWNQAALRHTSHQHDVRLPSSRCPEEDITRNHCLHASRNGLDKDGR